MATIQVDYVADWPGRLLSRFYEQFKGKPNLTALARDVFGPQVQAVEDAAQSLLMLPSIDAGQGAQLDLIGRLVGQQREGLPDATFQLYLHARVAANTSRGLPDQLYAVAQALLGLSASVALQASSPGTVMMLVETPTTDATAAVVARFLADAVIDGVRVYVVWQDVADASAFVFDGGATGLGFGDVNNPATGGAMSGAVVGVG